MSPRVKLTRRYRFSASHRLHSPQLSPERNRALYGKCNNPFGHGHDYELEVTVSGLVDGSGCAASRTELNRLVDEQVLQPMGHHDLNADVAEFRGDLVPTTENLALVIRDRLCRNWAGRFGPGVKLERVLVRETKRNIFELGQ